MDRGSQAVPSLYTTNITTKSRQYHIHSLSLTSDEGKVRPVRFYGRGSGLAEHRQPSLNLCNTHHGARSPSRNCSIV